jgi:hypothetical protein
MKSAPTVATLRIVLERPPEGIVYALQRGHGSGFDVVQKQKSNGSDLRFEFQVTARAGKGLQPNITGEFVQGPVTDRFVYLNIGTYAGQQHTCWSRRLKVPLIGITYAMLSAGKVLVANVPGTDQKGEPSCAYAWRKAAGQTWGWKLQN